MQSERTDRTSPAEALDWLHRESMKALAAADVRDRFTDQGLVPGNSSRDEYAKLMLDDGKRQRFVGNYVVRRVNDVDGATAEQRRWHLESAQLRPVG